MPARSQITSSFLFLLALLTFAALAMFAPRTPAGNASDAVGDSAEAAVRDTDGNQASGRVAPAAMPYQGTQRPRDMAHIGVNSGGRTHPRRFN